MKNSHYDKLEKIYLNANLNKEIYSNTEIIISKENHERSGPYRFLSEPKTVKNTVKNRSPGLGTWKFGFPMKFCIDMGVLIFFQRSQVMPSNDTNSGHLRYPFSC